MSDIQTLAANMRNAFFERKGATIGGGKFTPKELRDGAIALRAYPYLLEALDEIVTLLVEQPESYIHVIEGKARTAIREATWESQ